MVHKELLKDCADTFEAIQTLCDKYISEGREPQLMALIYDLADRGIGSAKANERVT